MINKLALVFLFVSVAVSARAQTIDDGIMVARRSLFAGGLYGHDAWDHYWEGALERDNGNIGTVTTQTNVWYANYGVTDRLNVIGMVPYVWTKASQGVLHGTQGLQDLTVAAKWNFFHRPFAKAALRTFAVVSAGFPLTDYDIELLPLSIGTRSSRVSGRVTANVQTNPGWYVDGSTAYTWRSSTTLDRPYFFTDDEFVMSDEVNMPDMFDYVVHVGYLKHGLNTHFAFTQQQTLGGGDIRRQDIPFPSNRMDFIKLGGMAMYPVPKLNPLAFQFSYAYTVTGRNVGQAHAVTIGLLYTFNSGRSPTQ